MQPMGARRDAQKDDEGDPEQVGTEQVEHLHPGGGEEGDVGDSEGILQEQQAGHGNRQRAIRCRAHAVIDEPEQEGSGDEADGGVHPAEADKPGTDCGEVLSQSGAETGGGKKSIAESGERAADSDDEHGGEAGEGKAGGAEFDAAAHKALFAREEMRGESQSGEQEQGVGEVQGEIDGAGRRLVVGDLAEQDEQGSEKRLVQSENKGRDSSSAGEMTAGNGAEGPEEQADDGEERDAAHGAVGEFDQCRGGGMVLDDSAVAERPVISAACAGAGGAHGCSPEHDGDVVGEDGPGIAIHGSRIGVGARRRCGNSGAAAFMTRL